MCLREGKDRQAFRDVLFYPIGQVGSRFGVFLNGSGQILVGSWTIRSGKDPANVGSDFGLHLLARHGAARRLERSAGNETSSVARGRRQRRPNEQP